MKTLVSTCKKCGSYNVVIRCNLNKRLEGFCRNCGNKSKEALDLDKARLNWNEENLC